MEILEIIFALAQLGECFFACASLCSGAGAAVETVRGKKNREERREAKQAGEKPPPLSVDNWVAIFLFIICGFSLVLLVVALLASQGR